MRHARLLPSLAVLVAFALGACASEPTGVVPDQESREAIAEFTRLADSLTAAGADPGVALGYRGLAAAVRSGGALSSVVVTVDGTPAEYAAMAREVDLERTGACAQPGSLCLMAPPLRTMVAWQRSSPRRVVQLVGSAGWMSGLAAGTARELPALTYFDGAGGVFVGSNGAREISDPVVTGAPCAVESSSSVPQPVSCRRAQFSVSFSGTVEPSPRFASNPAVGTHLLSMTPQRVDGRRILLGPPLDAASVPPVYFPPIDPRGPVLPATISVTVGAGGVTFTLAITNPAATPAELRFSSGQQFDFRVRRPDGTSVWTWSADMGFITALTSRTLAPGERVAYTATWNGTAPGSYVVDGVLTSTSHQAAATATFVVP